MSDNFGLDIAVSKDQTLAHDESLETSASELMDELFAKLEQKLQEGDTPPPTSSSSSLTTRARSRQSLSVLEASSDLEVSYTPIETALTPRHAPDWQLSLDETIGIGNPQDSRFNQRLFCCIALTSIGAALVWIGTQLAPRSITTPVVADATTQSVSSLPTNPADVQFAASMAQSLQKIDRKKSAPPVAQPAVAQPVVTAPPVTTPAPPQQSKTLSKPSLPTVSSVQAAAPKLPATIPANVTPARIPAKQVPVPAKSAPQAAATEETELPQLQPEAQPHQPNVTDAPQTVAVAKPAPLTDVSKASQTLVGVLEFGDQSVALVENNGATRRVEIGEVLNESGWTLAGVENGQAIVKRNGQVRALDPDQKF